MLRTIAAASLVVLGSCSAHPPAPCSTCTGGGASAGGGDAGASGGGAGGGVGVCDPVTQEGCAADQRCAWAVGVGLQCVADGTLDAGAPCLQPDAGSDDCKRGSACGQGVCNPV